LGLLVDKDDKQIAARVRSAISVVQIFPFIFAFLTLSEFGSIVKDFFNLILKNLVLALIFSTISSSPMILLIYILPYLFLVNYWHVYAKVLRKSQALFGQVGRESEAQSAAL